MNKLTIKNLKVSAEDKTIINNFSYTFESGNVYALIGPNGHGKSTLLSTIMGDPNYEVVSGNISYNDEEITTLEVEDRAKMGVFLAMQYPPEIPGIKTLDLISSSLTALKGKQVSPFMLAVDAKLEAKNLRMNDELIHRDLNVGFSGGEKKKTEILQMKMIKPKVIMLDEIDSGLDVDSIRSIAEEISTYKKEGNIFIIISHYKELYDIIKPNKFVMIKDGHAFKDGNFEQLMQTLEKGFD